MKFADSITANLGAAGTDVFRGLVEEYSREHNVPMADIAAALALQSRDGEAFLMKPEPPAAQRSSKQKFERSERPDRKGPPKDGFATYRIAVGKRHKVNPGAIVGALANEGGLHRSDFGHITIKVDHSLVELPAKLSGKTLKALEQTRIQGQLINLRRDTSEGKPERGDRSGGHRKRMG